MALTARIVPRVPGEPAITVDGTFGTAGLNLSHWPGNTTPSELRHDLSTGIALNFARLSPTERQRLSGGAQLVVNNHYDTDGCCAAFAVLHPDQALALEERLLAIATCGDFYGVPDDNAFCCDAIITNMADPRRSPLGSRLEGVDDYERYTRAQAEVLRLLPSLCAGELEPLRAMWEPELTRLEADLALLDECRRREDTELDLTIWSSESGVSSAAPGRHALFGLTGSDRVMFLGQGPAGTTARLVVSTLSWFDLVSVECLPRPDLESLAAELNEVEGTRPGDPTAWRAQSSTNASPELWFGGSTLDSFAEHNEVLESSRLGAEEIEAMVRGAL